MNEVRQTCFGLTALALPLAVMAQGTAVEEQYFTEFPVVLTASRLAQRADEAPASVTVIDRDMINASGARELADVLRLVPGMTVGRSSGYQPILGYFGFGDSYFRQFQVLVDGVSIYNPLWGGVEWGELPFSIEDVDRVEVVRGPNAATYGANSFLGVVNIITRDPATEPKFQASANAGNDGVRDFGARVARSEGDWRYRLSVGQRSDEGLAAVPDTRRSNFLNLRTHLRLPGQDEVRFQFGYSGGTGGTGKYSGVGDTDAPNTGRFEQYDYLLRWTRTPDADNETWVQLSHQERRYHEVLDYNLGALFPFFPMEYPISSNYEYRRTDLELQQTMRPHPDVRAVWGLQYRQDGVRSQPFFNRPDWLSSSLSRIHGNVEWRFANDWLIHVAGMYEDNSLTGSKISPTVALVHHFLPGQTLRARVSKAYRTPSMFEAMSNYQFPTPPGLSALLGLPPPQSSWPIVQSSLSQPGLQDERILSRELSYMGEFPSVHLTANITVFYDQLRDIISQYTYPYSNSLSSVIAGFPIGIFGFRNHDWADLHGTSVNLQWQPWQGARLTVAGSQSTIKSNDQDHAWSLSAPWHTVSALFRQELPSDLALSIGYYRVGSMQWIGGDQLPAFDQVDLKLTKTLRWNGQRLDVSLVSQNAFGNAPTFNTDLTAQRTTWLRLQYAY